MDQKLKRTRSYANPTIYLNIKNSSYTAQETLIAQEEQEIRSAVQHNPNYSGPTEVGSHLLVLYGAGYTQLKNT